MAQFLNHLHVVFHALLDTLGLDIVAQFLEEGYLLHQVVLNMTDGDVGLLLCRHKEIGWIELVFVERGHSQHGIGIQFLNGIYLVVPECDPQNGLAIGDGNVNGVAFHTEVAAFQFYVVTDV